MPFPPKSYVLDIYLTVFYYFPAWERLVPNKGTHHSQKGIVAM